MRIKKLFLPIILVLVLIISFFLYFPISFGTFQHDEWAVLSRFFLHKQSFLQGIIESFAPFINHYVPFHRVFVQIYLRLFGLNYPLYSLASISAHLLIIYLLYLFFRRLFNNSFYGEAESSLYALLTSSLFGLGAAGHQATSWPLSDINTHGATIFAILSLIYLFKFFEGRSNPWIPLLFLIISLLFKEIAIGFFLLIPLTVYIFGKSIFKKGRKFFIPFTVTLFFYIALRGIWFLTPRLAVTDKLVTSYQTYSEIVFNIATFPIKTLSQTIIPITYFLPLAKFVTTLFSSDIVGEPGTTFFDQFVEGATLQVLGLLIFIGIIFYLTKIRSSKIDKRMVKILLWSFLFIVINSFVYVFSPGRGGSVPVIDSRNLYFPFIGTSLLLVSMFIHLSKGLNSKLLFLVIPIIVLNIFSLRKEVEVIAQRGVVRKKILNQIKHDYPSLPKKVVFYTQSDTSFYGLPEGDKILPFQTNFGSNLFIWYLPTEKFPAELADNGWFLYKLEEEGYKEFDGRGFGYFRNLDRLKETIKQYTLEVGSIISYEYSSKTGILEDISNETRLKIAK